jgi:hypothetical protein
MSGETGSGIYRGKYFPIQHQFTEFRTVTLATVSYLLAGRSAQNIPWEERGMFRVFIMKLSIGAACFLLYSVFIILFPHTA